MIPSLQGYIGQPDQNVKTLKRELVRRTGINQSRPSPPRGLRISNGVLIWEAPANTTGITHYNVYADTETNLVRQVSAKQLQMGDSISASRWFVTSYNATTQLESTPAFLGAASQIGPVGPVAAASDVFQNFAVTGLGF